MAKSTQQKEAAAIWHQEQMELECQEQSRSNLYGIYKMIRDVGSTGDPELDELAMIISAAAHKVRSRLDEISEE